MARVASFGSVNVDRVATVDADTLADLRARDDWFPAPGETRTVEALPPDLDEYVTEVLLGGKGANQSVAAARAGAESHLYGAVGRDATGVDADAVERGADAPGDGDPPADGTAPGDGDDPYDGGPDDGGPDDGGAPGDAAGVRGTLADRGVDVSAVEVVDAPTGTASVFVGPDGENHIAILGGANDAVDPAYAHAQVESVRAADVLLLQNEVPRVATDALLTALSGQHDRPTVLLDPAPAEGAADLLRHPAVDLVTPNETEVAALSAELGEFDGTVVRTRGPDPVVVETPTERFEVATPPASAVDTTGAGDVFAGYLGAELARGTDLREAVEWAATAASLSVEASGVQRATPDRETVRVRVWG
jgi:ribokinase